jgi:hypothetical protein
VNRQQWRHFERRLRKLITPGTCSLCGSELEHNCETYGGFDWDGEVALAAECCVDRLAEIHTLGLFSARRYDFLMRASEGPATKPVPNEQRIDAIAAHRKAIAMADDLLGDSERNSGVARKLEIHIDVHEWTIADREWFASHPTRSHRMRAPVAGEIDDATAPDHVLIMLIRQARPGVRIRAKCRLYNGLLPLPTSDDDEEALAHALFEIVNGREPSPTTPEAFTALLEKYRATHDGGRA